MFGWKNGDEYVGFYIFDLDFQKIEKRIFGVDGYDVFVVIEYLYIYDVVGVVYIDDWLRYYFFDDCL